MSIAYGDLETYSERDLKKCGTHAYAEVAEIMLFPYALEDGEVECWDVTTGEPAPRELIAALADPNTQWVFHNGGMFDLTVMLHAGGRVGLPPLPHSRIFDTMVCAMAHSLPGSLEMLGDIFGLGEDKAKMKEGKALIQLFCKPRPKKQKLRRATRETHPVEWAKFVEYAKHDISAMREVYKKLPKWNYKKAEYALWLLDQRINQRGVAIDLQLVHAAEKAVELARAALAVQTDEMTDGAVASATQRGKMLEYVFEFYGIHFDDLRKDTLERACDNPDIPEPVKELLSVRMQSSSTSVKKFSVLARATSADGRMRGLLQFAGAGRTARWAGRTFQPQNLTRPKMQQAEIEFAIEVIKANGGTSCDMFYGGDVMPVLADVVRSCLIAPEGRKLCVADLSNIEGRVAAWLAGENWKLQYFRDYDAGVVAFDNYMMAYSKSFGVTPEVVAADKKAGGVMRQIGKVQELMLQYEGGVGAFVTGAATYHVDLEDMARKALPVLPDSVVQESRSFLEWLRKKKKGSTHGLPDDVFIACDAIKRLWRAAQPEITSYWPELRDAALSAISCPGKIFHARKIAACMDGSWLRLRLPSGRFLCYPSARIEENGSISYMGIHQYTRKWVRLYTYGGKLFENVCQAVARDVMADAMPRAEAAGYEIVLTVHDELVTEAPDEGEFCADGLSTIMSTCPAWATDLPLAAAGFESYRYKKD
jgi:DNA polymerase